MAENMLKKAVAYLAGKLVLGFKMTVKGAATYIGCFYNIFDTYFFVAGFVEQADESVDDGLTCLLLASVHMGTSLLKCTNM